MNRVPLRDGGRKQTDDLEKRVNILTGLVLIQLVLLLVLFVIEFVPSFSSISSLFEKSETSGIVEEQVASMDTDDIEPVVEEEETGSLPPEVEPGRPIRIEILNGCGVPKLAAEFADLLRSEGYDVRDTRNADSHNYEHSQIFDRTSMSGQALRLSSILGISSENVKERANPQLVDIDLTFVLGKDHTTLKLQP